MPRICPATGRVMSAKARPAGWLAYCQDVVFQEPFHAQPPRISGHCRGCRRRRSHCFPQPVRTGPRTGQSCRQCHRHYRGLRRRHAADGRIGRIPSSRQCGPDQGGGLPCGRSHHPRGLCQPYARGHALPFGALCGHRAEPRRSRRPAGGQAPAGWKGCQRSGWPDHRRSIRQCCRCRDR